MRTIAGNRQDAVEMIEQMEHIVSDNIGPPPGGNKPVQGPSGSGGGKRPSRSPPGSPPRGQEGKRPHIKGKSKSG